MEFNELFQSLNEYQREAVLSMDKYSLLNACVGSGKTTVITAKALYLNKIKDVPLNDMYILTFTNKAAFEIKNRIGEFIEFNEEEVNIGTFHSIARSILNKNENLEKIGYKKDFEVYDNERAFELLKGIIEKEGLNIKYKNKLIKRVEGFKNGKTLYGVMKKDDDIGVLIEKYNEEKRYENVMDFDDLINFSNKVLDKPINPSWIIIDEFQDTDLKQFEMIERIKGDRTHIFAVGDPYQIIYSWRTGTDKIFETYKDKFKPREFSLPVNYRSSRTIVEAASAFLGEDIKGVKDYENPIRVVKNYDAFNEALFILRSINKLHSDGVPYSEIGVLYRRRKQEEVLINVLKEEAIPFKVLFKKDVPVLEKSEAEEGVNLMTLHLSKGLEFSHVFIIGANMGNIPLTTKRGEEEEEARLFFVGITRAKEGLTISYLTKPNINGVLKYPSPYIGMIPKNLIQSEDEGKNISLKELINLIRDEREKKESTPKEKTITHPKYGEGKVIYEDDNIIRASFEGYGEKEFSKAFYNF